ncbi:mitochondrial 37S ribosomal protein uS9m [Limtongia smithiae]|uniref:mitochondrial 37S ribosomal protein uS9m n=1 Tax=Limtongia smithiae TaxID=1125753 RepID=UPI0034CF02F8
MGLSDRPSTYHEVMAIIKQLASIRPDVAPEEVRAVLNRFAGRVSAQHTRERTRKVDVLGRAYAKAKRKNARARVWVVSGRGEVRVNGRGLDEAFGRVRDRESAVAPLRVAGQQGVYNVHAEVEGGGTTGQAQAVALALARALREYNPALGKILRDAACLKQDLRVVERKKPGKLKARKSPQWVKR